MASLIVTSAVAPRKRPPSGYNRADDSRPSDFWTKTWLARVTRTKPHLRWLLSPGRALSLLLSLRRPAATLQADCRILRWTGWCCRRGLVRYRVGVLWRMLGNLPTKGRAG